MEENSDGDCVVAICFSDVDNLEEGEMPME